MPEKNGTILREKSRGAFVLPHARFQLQKGCLGTAVPGPAETPRGTKADSGCDPPLYVTAHGGGGL